MSEYKDKIKDPINRTIEIMNNYNGKYEVTQLINTGFVILGMFIENYVYKNENKREIDCAYEALEKLSESKNVEIIKQTNKNIDKKQYLISLRNALAHCNVKTSGDGENISNIELNGDVLRHSIKITTEFKVENFKNFIIKIADLMTL